ncbi:MAG: biotin transporter BioY [Acidobacteria bacterium]|nr:biotin transporter BioY [Acidobacteriota bacterium]MBV9070792.1 biotin transporter BioY [Acidobacteriota bacterium]MBV9475326.1 biotin transporter BioY [Acidobacteriota bacterium]
MSEKAMTIPAAVDERIRGRVAANMLLVVTASALIALAAQVAIPLPFTPVPLTLQPLAVIFLGAALGARRGAAAAALYLLEGFSGLPVFAQGHGGPLWLVGPTAGYLYSYPFAAWLSGFVSERGWGSTISRAVTGMLLALAVIYTGGWSWLAMLTGARNAFSGGVAPFIVADIVKVAIGAALLPKAQRVVGRV